MGVGWAGFSDTEGFTWIPRPSANFNGPSPTRFIESTMKSHAFHHSHTCLQNHLIPKISQFPTPGHAILQNTCRRLSSLRSHLPKELRRAIWREYLLRRVLEPDVPPADLTAQDLAERLQGAADWTLVVTRGLNSQSPLLDTRVRFEAREVALELGAWSMSCALWEGSGVDIQRTGAPFGSACYCIHLHRDLV